VSKLNHKLLRSRRFQLELLESRELLSVVALPDLQAAEVSPLKQTQPETIKGTLSGRAHLVPITFTKGTTTFKAGGTTSVLGSTTLTGSVAYSTNKHLVVNYTKGVATLADLSGDQIKVSYTGSGHVVGVGDFTFSVNGSVTGGTGKFAGAKGKFTATGSNDLGAFSIQLTVTLTKI
jgi:hypothetical protein